jgi:hypothetical protein
MSSTLLRLGLWLLVILMALFVVRESYAEQQFVEMIPTSMLQHALILSALLVVAGLVVRVFDKGVSSTSKARCRVCKTAIPQGAIYCRQHLRNVLEREDRRTHSNTRIR